MVMIRTPVTNVILGSIAIPAHQIQFFSPAGRILCQYPKLFFAVTLPVFLLCVLGGNLLQWTVGAMVNHRKAVRL